MSSCYYDTLEMLLVDIQQWRQNAGMSKEDVLDSTRKRVVMLMRQVQVTPLIGSAYAYPGDMDLTEIMKAYTDEEPA